MTSPSECSSDSGSQADSEGEAEPSEPDIGHPAEITPDTQSSQTPNPVQGMTWREWSTSLRQQTPSNRLIRIRLRPTADTAVHNGADRKQHRSSPALVGIPEEKRNVGCRLCAFVATCLTRLRIHVRQHFGNNVCGCGDMSYRHDAILKHLGKERSGKHFGEKGCIDRVVYEVDEATFSKFRAAINNPAVEFLPLKPLQETTTGSSNTTRAKPVENLPSGSNPGDNRRGDESPDPDAPPPSVFYVSGITERMPAPTAAVKHPIRVLSRKARKAERHAERDARLEKQRMDRQAERARASGRTPPLAASSVDLAQQPRPDHGKDGYAKWAKPAGEDSTRQKTHEKATGQTRDDREKAKKLRPRSRSAHVSQPMEDALPYLRTKLDRLCREHTTTASATPASSTTGPSLNPFPPLHSLQPTYADMAQHHTRLLQ